MKKFKISIEKPFFFLFSSFCTEFVQTISESGSCEQRILDDFLFFNNCMINRKEKDKSRSNFSKYDHFGNNVAKFKWTSFEYSNYAGPGIQNFILNTGVTYSKFFSSSFSSSFGKICTSL